MIPKESFMGDSSCNSRDLPYRLSIASRSHGGKIWTDYASSLWHFFCGNGSCLYCQEARSNCCATTRNKNKIDAIRNNGADYVIVDNRQIASELNHQLSRDDDNRDDGVSWFFCS